MSYPVVTGAILEMQLRYRVQGQQLINTFHYKWGAGLDMTTAIMDELINDFQLKVTSFFAPRVTNNVTNITIRGQFVYPTRFVFLERDAIATQGTVNEQMWTIGSSLVIRKRSDIASRSSRGRVFVGGLPISAYVDGTVSAAVVTDWQSTFANGMVEGIQSALAATGADPVVWSLTDPTNADLITATNVDSFVRYQRRREVGRGI